MLKLACIYKEELNILYQKTIFDDKYKYANSNNYFDYNFKLDNDSWNSLEFVSVDRNNKVIGYFKASINRIANFVSSLYVLNFYDKNITFSKDLKQFINDLFKKFDFNKINFNVVCGNPAEKMYDKYIEKYGGRIVGTFYNDTKLYDNRYYDVKHYELYKGGFLICRD